MLSVQGHNISLFSLFTLFNALIFNKVIFNYCKNNSRITNTSRTSVRSIDSHWIIDPWAHDLLSKKHRENIKQSLYEFALQ